MKPLPPRKFEFKGLRFESARLRHAKEIDDICGAVFRYPLTIDQTRDNLQIPTLNALVIRKKEDPLIIGYMEFVFEDERTALHTIAVHYKFHRQRLGSTCLDFLKSPMLEKEFYQQIFRQNRISARSRIDAKVWEENDPAKEFFRANGFRLTKIRREYPEEVAEDNPNHNYYVYSFDREIKLGRIERFLKMPLGKALQKGAMGEI